MPAGHGRGATPSRRWCATQRHWTRGYARNLQNSCPAREQEAAMKPPPFSYHDPRTVADVVGLLSRLENAKLLAGGQSLMPMLNFRAVLPDHIIDLNLFGGLSHIRETGGGMEF